jgi:hypothetical protein
MRSNNWPRHDETLEGAKLCVSVHRYCQTSAQEHHPEIPIPPSHATACICLN